MVRKEKWKMIGTAACEGPMKKLHCSYRVQSDHNQLEYLIMNFLSITHL